MDLGMQLGGMPGQEAQVPMGGAAPLDPQMARQILMEHADMLGLTADAIRRMSDEQVIQIFQQVQDALMGQAPEAESMQAPGEGMGTGMEMPAPQGAGMAQQPMMGFGGYIHPMQVSSYQELPVRSPDETLAENRHRWAEARDKAANSTEVKVLQALSDISGLVSAGAQAYGTGNWGGFARQLDETANRYDTGGVVPVEVEGQEMYETPQGQVGTFTGPSHEEGGIPVAMPEGTKIYSQRVKEQGQSMAGRKRRRDAALRNAELELERRPTDPIAKRTLKRIQEINAEEDARDMEVQSLLHEATHQIAESFALGGFIHDDPQAGKRRIVLPEEEEKRRRHLYAFEGAGEASTAQASAAQPVRSMARMEPVKPIMPKVESTIDGKLRLNGIYDQGKKPPQRGNLSEGVGTATMGVGDILKAYAHINAVNEAELNQLAYEASQQPFRNQHRDFGLNAIAEAEAQKPYIQQQLDHQLKQLRLQTNADKTRLRNTAGSVNTLRALDVASEEQHQVGVGNAYQQAMQQMQAVRQQLATLQNERDARVMAGEDDRDLNQREQEAQNYKNRQTIISSRHKALESIGTIANNFQENKSSQDLLNRYSRYRVQANASTGDVDALPDERMENEGDELYSDAARPAQDYPSDRVPSLHGKQPTVKETQGDPLPKNLEAENDEARQQQEKLRMQVHQAKLDNLNARTEQIKAQTEAIRNPQPKADGKKPAGMPEPTEASVSGMFTEPPEPGKTREESLGGDALLKKHEEMAGLLRRVSSKNYRITSTPEQIQDDLEHALRGGGDPQRLLVYFLEQLGGRRIDQLTPEQGELLYRYIIDLTVKGQENPQ